MKIIELPTEYIPRISDNIISTYTGRENSCNCNSFLSEQLKVNFKLSCYKEKSFKNALDI